jgi:tetratricopeptide (TPR) repeat protein
MRLLLGDLLWLVLLLGGAAGLWLARGSPGGGRSSFLGDPRWVFVPWALYTLLTAAIFHVELRYRLPLYPVLLPYAAWALAGGLRPGRLAARRSSWRALAAGLTCALLVGLTLLHRPYIGEAWRLGWKHLRLWQASRALAGGDPASARRAANSALAWDPGSALARVALARAELQAGDRQAALAALEAAQEALPAHPYAHLLRGALLRAQREAGPARAELSYETASLEDLQRWAWSAFEPISAPPDALDVGGGLDLGFVRGFFAPEEGGFRWSGAVSEVVLAVPRGGAARLDLRLASGRPAGAPEPAVVVLVDGRELGRVEPGQAWRTYSLPIPPDFARPREAVVVTIRSDTARPRDYDRASPDNRALGVMVDRVELVAGAAGPTSTPGMIREAARRDPKI